jgi:hypothetical protein
MPETVVNTGARFTVRVQPVYTTYGTKRHADAGHDALHMSSREWRGKSNRRRGFFRGKSAQCYQPAGSIEPSLTVA